LDSTANSDLFFCANDDLELCANVSMFFKVVNGCFTYFSVV